MIEIIITDDHPVVREGLKQIIADMERFKQQYKKPASTRSVSTMKFKLSRIESKVRNNLKPKGIAEFLISPTD